MFLLLGLWGQVLKAWHYTNWFSFINFRNIWLTIAPIYQLALMFNSSVNFVIYSILGKEFKEELVKLLCPSKKWNPSHLDCRHKTKPQIQDSYPHENLYLVPFNICINILDLCYFFWFVNFKIYPGVSMIYSI